MLESANQQFVSFIEALTDTPRLRATSALVLPDAFTSLTAG